MTRVLSSSRIRAGLTTAGDPRRHPAGGNVAAKRAAGQGAGRASREEARGAARRRVLR